MGYNSTSFLKAYNTQDKNLLIYDENGILKFTINPFSISNVQVRGNVITISIKSGRTILLDFLNSNYALDALPILQDRIRDLTREKSVHIDKQIENWVENIDLITTTLSVAGNIVPSLDYTWNLGSTTSRWNNIYVRDALVASQSLYIGDLKISTVENDKTGEAALVIGDKETPNYVEIAPDGLGGVLIGETNLDLYNGVVIGEFETPTKGQVVTLTIPPFQSWKEGDNAKFFNAEVNDYNEEGYSDDDIHSFFIGRVQTYDPVTGEISVVVDDSYNVGLTFSELTFKLNTDNPKITNIVQAIDGDVIPDAGLTYNLGTSEKSWNNLYIGDLEVSVVDSNLSVNGVKIAKYEGISETLLTTPTKGEVVTIDITPGLDLSTGGSLIIENNSENPYVEEGYSEDDEYMNIIGTIDSYDKETGRLVLEVKDSTGVGKTSSTWQVKLNLDPPRVANIVQAIDGDVIPDAGLTYNLGTTEKSWNNLYIGDLEVSVVDSNLSVNGVKIANYNGVSEDLLSIPSVGEVITFNTSTGLDLRRGDTVNLYNDLQNEYIDEGYSEDDIYLSVVGIVDSYDRVTGEMTIISQDSYGVGETSSNWQVSAVGNGPVSNRIVIEVGSETKAGSIIIYGGTESSPVVLATGRRKVRSNTRPVTQMIVNPKYQTAIDGEDQSHLESELGIGNETSSGQVSISGGTTSGEILIINARGPRKVRSNTRPATQAVITTSGTNSSIELAIGDDYFGGLISIYGGTTSLPEVLLSGEYGIGTSPTYSFFKIDSNAVLLNKVYFGATTADQSIYVSGGNLYVNDTVFVGGGGGGAGSTGPQGSGGPTGVQGNTGPQGLVGQRGADAAATLNSPVVGESSITITHSYGAYPLVQVIKNDGSILPLDQYTLLHSGTYSYNISFGSPFTGYVVTGGGLSGPQGDIGPQGSYGSTGFQGNTGPQGDQGITGPQGPAGGGTGAQGNTGPQGPAGGGTGAQGITGPQGTQGAVGPTGNSGTSAEWYFQGTWSAGILPAIGDIYTFNGETWYSNGNATGTPSVANGWNLLASKGATGAQGSSGGTGVQGNTGPQGFTGAQGPTGPTITSFTFSNDILSIILTNATYSVTLTQFINLSTNNLTVNSFNGVDNRIVEATTTGSLTASRSIYTTYITDATAQTQIVNLSNWTDNGVWIGSTVANVYAGQRHYDTNYLYEAVTGNGSNATFIRLLRG
jgi:hypothetical protein